MIDELLPIPDDFSESHIDRFQTCISDLGPATRQAGAWLGELAKEGLRNRRATPPDAAKDAQRKQDRLDAERYRKICSFNSYLDDLFDCCVEKSDYDKLLDRMTLAAPDQGDV